MLMLQVSVDAVLLAILARVAVANPHVSPIGLAEYPVHHPRLVIEARHAAQDKTTGPGSGDRLFPKRLGRGLVESLQSDVRTRGLGLVALVAEKVQDPSGVGLIHDRVGVAPLAGLIASVREQPGDGGLEAADLLQLGRLGVDAGPLGPRPLGEYWVLEAGRGQGRPHDGGEDGRQYLRLAPPVAGATHHDEPSRLSDEPQEVGLPAMRLEVAYPLMQAPPGQLQVDLVQARLLVAGHFVFSRIRVRPLFYRLRREVPRRLFRW